MPDGIPLLLLEASLVGGVRGRPVFILAGISRKNKKIIPNGVGYGTKELW
jgi:hypothetical protein